MRRLVRVGLIALLLGAAMPSSSASPPVLRESSVDKGWTNVDYAVSARYSSTLDYSVSTASLTDVNGTAVRGSTRVHINTITFVPEARIQHEHGPFEVTFDVRSVYQAPGDPNTVDTLRFQVDVHDPFKPVLRMPDATVAVPDADDRSPGYQYLARIVVVDPTEPFELQGTAQEAGDAQVFDWSGIARIEARFFDHEGREVEQHRKQLSMDCEEGCPFEPSFSIAADPLPPGYWTARVGAYDFAGNRSADSESASFFVVR